MRQNLVKLKNYGFIYIPLTKEVSKFIEFINQEIKNYFNKNKINLNRLKNHEFNKEIFKLQNKINSKKIVEKFFHINKKIFINLFENNKFAVQHYFYLRVVKKKKNENQKPVSYHRESFHGPSFFKHIYNLWIPIENCSSKNSIKYFPNSHKMKINKDFKIKKYSTDVKKLSFAHKTGNLYLERKINFKKKLTQKDYSKKSI